MKTVAVINLSRQNIPPVAVYCDSFLCRLRGLTFRHRLGEKEGLLLVQARDSRLDSSIHMFFVFMDLGVVWLNDALEVVDTCLARPWRPAYFPKKPARYVLEISPASLGDFKVGDCVQFEQVWLD